MKIDEIEDVPTASTTWANQDTGLGGAAIGGKGEPGGGREAESRETRC